MGCLGNILWALCAGIWLALGWAVAGLIWCLTIIGIPVGLQCFKLAGLALMPFGRDVHSGGGAGSLLLNLCWIVFGGLELALGYAAAGCIWCITIVGIPFGKQFFKIAKLALTPFGARVE